MSVKVDRIPGEPIIIATLIGAVTTEMVLDVFQQSARLAEEIESSIIYRIADVCAITTTFAEMVRILGEASQAEQPGSAADPRFRPILVGTNEWAQMYSNSLKQEQYGGISVPVFATYDDALDHIHRQRAKQK
jgi:hypothetical protein